MVEVYSTNVENHKQEDFLLQQLGQVFPDYNFNFDLEDCDRILRIESKNGPLDATGILRFLEELDFSANVLPD